MAEQQFPAAGGDRVPSARVRAGAERALALHPLHAADALQLAAALVWAGEDPGAHELVCLDRRLREAAVREGLALLPVA